MFFSTKLHGATFGIVLQDDKKSKSKIEKIQYNIENYGSNIGNGKMIRIDPGHKSTDRFRIQTVSKGEVIGDVEVVAGSGASTNTFRTDAMHYLLLSEIDFWQNAETVWRGIKPTLTQTQGMVQIESTPNGFGLFHDLYVQNKGKIWTKQTDFVSLFYPWTSHTEYSLSPPSDWQPCDDDYEYMRRYGISLSQACWRREVGFEGEINPTKRQLLDFAREYPASDVDCWEETIESSPFNMENLKKMSLEDRYIAEKQGVRVYEQAQGKKTYFMGVDIAEGDKVKRGDDNAFVIIDNDGEICVLYNSPDLSYLEYGSLIYEYAERYRPHVVIEINKDYGAVIADYLKSEKYPENLITRFRTTGTAQGTGSKPEVISALDKWIMVHDKIKDDELRKQMVGYTKIKNDQRKNRDDLVMALGFAVFQQQKTSPRKQKEYISMEYNL